MAFDGACLKKKFKLHFTTSFTKINKTIEFYIVCLFIPFVDHSSKCFFLFHDYKLGCQFIPL